MIFLLIIRGGSLDRIDRDLSPRAKEVGGVRGSEYRERAPGFGLSYQKIPGAGGLEK